MNVGQMNDGKPVKRRRQAGNRNFIGVYLKAVPFDKKGIARHQRADTPVYAAFDELSAINQHSSLILGSREFRQPIFSPQGVHKGGVH